MEISYVYYIIIIKKKMHMFSGNPSFERYRAITCHNVIMIISIIIIITLPS